jgi:hypothetical protein
MAVNLSPVGGVAAQFFTNTGAVLTGGKIYTYAAGTTTPATTFTSSQGTTAWTNPIVLDAAGRVPTGGEIWLTDGITYKFVLRDANDVLIATYDNISGINSNSVSFTNQQQIITATAGQTVFNLSISYQVATNSLSVFVDGVNQYGPGAQYAYTETSSTSVTFTNGLHVGAVVKFTTTQQQGAGLTNASQITYNPAGTGAVATNVQAKLRQYVSVMDFGATGNGTTNDTAAIQAAITACAGKNQLFFPDGDYLVTSSLTVPSTSYLEGAPGATILAGANSLTVFTTSGFTTGISFNSLAVQGNGKTGVTAFNLSNVQFHSQLDNINVFECAKGIVLDAVCIGIAIKNPTIFKTANAIEIKGNSNANTVTTPNIDNAVVTAGGTGTGTGIYILGGTNQVYGGFVQGFEFGVYDEGQYTGLDGVYFETCTNSAVFSNSAVACTYKNVFYFGYNAVASACYAFSGANCSGITVLYPSMVQGNSTGGVYYYVNGNTNCTEASIANNGTSNTNFGTPSQISPIGNATSQYKPIKLKNGTLATGATATPFTFNVGTPNSVSLCEVTLVAQEQTGFVATASRKFIFTLKNNTGTLTASAVSTDAAYTIDVSTANYGITVGAPTVTIVNSTQANFSFSLTTAGAIGWANCNYTVAAAVVGSSTNFIS